MTNHRRKNIAVFAALLGATGCGSASGGDESGSAACAGKCDALDDPPPQFAMPGSGGGNLADYHESVARYLDHTHNTDRTLESAFIALEDALDLQSEFSEAIDASNGPRSVATASADALNLLLDSLVDAIDRAVDAMGVEEPDDLRAGLHALGDEEDVVRTLLGDVDAVYEDLNFARQDLAESKRELSEAAVSGDANRVKAARASFVQARDALDRAVVQLDDLEDVRQRLQSVLGSSLRTAPSKTEADARAIAVAFLQGLGEGVATVRSALDRVTAAVSLASPKNTRVSISQSSDNDDLIRAANEAISSNTAVVEASIIVAGARAKAMRALADGLESNERGWIQLATILEERHAVSGSTVGPIFGEGAPRHEGAEGSPRTLTTRDWGDSGIAPLIEEINASSLENPLLENSMFSSLMAEPFTGDGGNASNIAKLQKKVGIAEANLALLKGRLNGISIPTSNVINETVFRQYQTGNRLSDAVEEYYAEVEHYQETLKRKLEAWDAEAGVERGEDGGLTVDGHIRALETLVRLANEQSKDTDPNGAYALYFDRREESPKSNDRRLAHAVSDALNAAVNDPAWGLREFVDAAVLFSEERVADTMKFWHESDSIRIGDEYVRPIDAFSYLGYVVATNPSDYYENAVSVTQEVFSSDSRALDLMLIHNDEFLDQASKISFQPRLHMEHYGYSTEGYFEMSAPAGGIPLDIETARSYFSGAYQPVRTLTPEEFAALDAREGDSLQQALTVLDQQEDLFVEHLRHELAEFRSIVFENPFPLPDAPVSVSDPRDPNTTAPFYGSTMVSNDTPFYNMYGDEQEWLDEARRRNE